MRNTIFHKNNLEVNINEVPYLSTYYIEPIVNPNEEVKIDLYISDYYQSNYLYENSNKRFTLTVKINNKI